MSLNLGWRRNRFKSPEKARRLNWKWPVFVVQWRSYARRAALVLLVVGGLAALTWALDRPLRVISMEGSFQRVSPGQIE